MVLPCYLAMTAAEFSAPLPPRVAYMACHFSSSSTGLSNLPEQLPEKAMLILDDSTPYDGHDPEKVAHQLEETVKAWNCCALLLDFQRPDVQEVDSLCHTLTKKLSCPVIVSQCYAKRLSCPVLVSPPPLLSALSDHLAPWQGREIWLEAALDKGVVTVTEEGSTLSPCTDTELPEPWFHEERLFCRYHWVLEDNTAKVTIMRTKEDLSAMLSAAKDLGVKGAVGLYQELKSPPCCH